jgi:hypothetical protein
MSDERAKVVIIGAGYLAVGLRHLPARRTADHRGPTDGEELISATYATCFIEHLGGFF